MIQLLGKTLSNDDQSINRTSIKTLQVSGQLMFSLDRFHGSHDLNVVDYLTVPREEIYFIITSYLSVEILLEAS